MYSINTVHWCDRSSYRTVHEEQCFPVSLVPSPASAVDLEANVPSPQDCELLNYAAGLGDVSAAAALVLCFKRPRGVFGLCWVWRSGVPCFWITCFKQSPPLSLGTVVSFHPLNSAVWVSPMAKTLCGLFFLGASGANEFLKEEQMCPGLLCEQSCFAIRWRIFPGCCEERPFLVNTHSSSPGNEHSRGWL